MRSNNNHLNKLTVDYRSKKIQHSLTINNTRISKYMKEFQTPQKRSTTNEKHADRNQCSREWPKLGVFWQ
jgi:hypothetical protein